jgi:alkanesulfonate monooxygenase SsuD/methylene tetrahydromethanopterin reductase-like flavin-dependent oxidoreductase (luciferase family)
VAQTAAIADGWMPVLIPLPNLADEIAKFKAMVKASGRDPHGVSVRTPGVTTVTNDVDKVRHENKAHVAFYVTNMGDFYREQLIRLGYEEAVHTIRRAWDEGGHAAGIASVPDDLVDSLHFAGSVEACRDRMAAYEEAGIDMISVNVDSADPLEIGRIFRQLQG